MSSTARSIPAWPAEAAAGGRTARGRRGALVPAAVLAALIIAAALAPLLAPASPEAIDLAGRHAPPSLAHPFGTDDLGRDLLSRILFGARISLAVGLLSAAVSGAVGVAVGAVAGYAGGWVDDILMRITDAMLSVPRLPLLMIAAAIADPGVAGLVLLVGLAGWMETARVVRAEFLSLGKRAFVEGARAAGAGHARVVLAHLLPNAAPAAAVATTLAIGRAILLESALSFFGVGVQPPTASWGNMLYQAQTVMGTEPWVAIFPGLFIFVTVVAVNRLGDVLSAARSSA
ncbi:MAG: ABC transporter permease [Gemmatimonadaceae bacterium]